MANSRSRRDDTLGATDALSISDFQSLTSTTLWGKDFTLADNLCLPSPAQNFGSTVGLPQCDLGDLGKLPLELLHPILAQLDIRTLCDLRSVNRRALQVVDGVPQFAAISALVPNALRGILSIGTGRYMSLTTLYDALCDSECECCGDFGGYLYLLTCRRVCLHCVTQNPSLLPLTREYARRKLGFSSSELDALPRMKTVPGTYSPLEAQISTRLDLVDADAALFAFEWGLPISSEPLSEFVQRCKGKYRRTKAFDPTPRDPFRYMAVIEIPHIVRRWQHELEWGAYCCACQDAFLGGAWVPSWRRKFTPMTMYAHLQQYGQVVDGRHQST